MHHLRTLTIYLIIQTDNMITHVDIHPFTRPPTYQPIYLFIRPSVRPAFHLSIYLSICLWLYSPLLDLGCFTDS
jgi:hypothetical protein